MSTQSANEQIEAQGFAILPRIVSHERCESLASEIMEQLESSQAESIGSRGGLVGGRNLIDSWNGWNEISSNPLVQETLTQSLGRSCGLVRILFFDKPPGKGWALSLHRDETIAVKSHQTPTSPYSKPTTKAGVPHVVANAPLLERMLTIRLHLDSMHQDNGPLIVIPESHRQQEPDRSTQTIHCQQGDAFVMRPLLLHGSLQASRSTQDHRRVIHLEFASSKDLEGGYQWHRFLPLLEP